MLAHLFKKISSSNMRRRGQILIPSLLVIPSLLIFVYLLFETTKISREKIRQQFAIDSAVFIQMGDYTNLFNRTAYVNGSFPYRIFKEQFGCSDSAYQTENTNGSGQKKCIYDMLYENGAFPANKEDTDSHSNEAKIDEASNVWKIVFSDQAGARSNHTGPIDGASSIGSFDLISKEQAVNYYLSWESVTGIYQFYAEVYSLLGSVEEAQWTVFKRITEKSTFFRKSYYLNAGTQECLQSPNSCANEAVRYFEDKAKIEGGDEAGPDFKQIFIKNIMFYAKIRTTGLSPYRIGATDPPLDMTKQTKNGLFQFAGVSAAKLKTIGNGIDVYQSWKAPPNYFNIDFNRVAACRETGKPCVHAKISSQCPKGNSGENNCIWPNPTPKYQTRLYP